MCLVRRGPIAAVVAVLVAAGVAGCTEAGKAAEPPSACQASVQAGEAKVRTERWDPPAELPDLGDYLEIHWQARAAGDPCDRAPGPTDWVYQGVVKLRPDDARKLAEQYEWGAASELDPPGPMWDALKPFVPDGVVWRRSRIYDQEEPQIRWRNLSFDPDRAVAWFALYDH